MSEAFDPKDGEPSLGTRQPGDQGSGPSPFHTVIMMGVSGCGKTTVGRRLAEQLAGRFVDGDDFHSAESIDKMVAGIPLSDQDRAGWLERLHQQIEQHDSDQGPLILACSALKRAYRARLRSSGDAVAFIHLHGPRELLLERLMARTASGEHFMPTSLLDSQIESLEPAADEPLTWTLGIKQPPEAIARKIAELLS